MAHKRQCAATGEGLILYMSLSTAYAQLDMAVKTLGLQHMSLKERLTCAWTQALSRIEATDLPSNLHADFQYLVERLTGNGTVQEMVSHMNDGDIDTVMRRIKGLAHAVEQAHDRRE